MNALAATPCPVPIASERQGESLAFSPDGRAYFTVGEFVFRPIYRFDLLGGVVP